MFLDLSKMIQHSAQEVMLVILNTARFIRTVCIHAGSADLCQGLTSISQQLVLDTFEVCIAETMYNLSLPIYVRMP